MKRITKKQKEKVCSKYRFLQIIDDLLYCETNDDKKEALRILKKEFIHIYGNN